VANRRFAKPGIGERLAERRSRRSDQDVIEDRKARAVSTSATSSNIQLTITIDFVRGPLVLGRDEGPLRTARRREARLQGDCRVDRDRREGGQPSVEKPQALGRIVVAVEEQAGIRRMVEARVERLQPGIGELGICFGSPPESTP